METQAEKMTRLQRPGPRNIVGIHLGDTQDYYKMIAMSPQYHEQPTEEYMQSHLDAQAARGERSQGEVEEIMTTFRSYRTESRPEITERDRDSGLAVMIGDIALGNVANGSN